jgi:flavin reductase (DIM6/NTAB) family NADH-FMN oxidoreductase RutF
VAAEVTGDALPDGDSGAADAFVSAADYPLCVVTTHADGEDSGCLAGFVTQCSIVPVRFIVCISKVNHTFGVAERSSGLAVHLLGSDQLDIAELFGEESGDWVDKFEQLRWSRGVTGAPLLAECACWIEGPIINWISGGDHEAFVIAVSGGGAGTREGSLMVSDASSLDAGHPA